MIGQITPLAAAEVGAVIVNFNAGPGLERAIESVTAEGVSRLVVVDNASSDSSWEVVPSEALIRNEKNVGFAKAVNQGARRLAELPLLLLLNPDARLMEGCLSALVAALDGDSRAAAAGPRIVDAAGRTVVSARRFPGPSVDILEAFRLTRLLRRSVRQRLVQGPLLPKEGQPIQVDWVSGACMLIRTCDWHALDGFSERFFLYGEELDWCWRATAAGQRCLYVPRAVSEHAGGVSASSVMTKGDAEERAREGVRLASRRNMHPLTFRAWVGTQRLMDWTR